MEAYINGILGGFMIGFAAILLMASLGRIAGISGILFSSLKSPTSNFWGILFLVGLVLGALAHQLSTGDPTPRVDVSLTQLVLGGLIVGFGVKLGSGCTSGHGVCGIGRLSIRSIVATLTFMTFGFITVFVRMHLL